MASMKAAVAARHILHGFGAKMFLLGCEGFRFNSVSHDLGIGYSLRSPFIVYFSNTGF